MSQRLRAFVSFAAFASTFGAAAPPPPLSHAYYRVLSGGEGAAPPFNVVNLWYGPSRDAGVAWELEARATVEPNAAPLFQLRCVTDRDPLDGAARPLVFIQYQLKVPGDGPVLEYRDIHTGGALLPPWREFADRFVPRPGPGTRRTQGIANTCTYLGHVLTLHHVGARSEWPAWAPVKILDLDPELLVGTGRVFKDAEGKRLPQQPERQNYTYVPWTIDDYRAMIEAGMNLFSIAPGCEAFLRNEPVFHLRGARGLSYPADLYRSNWAGPAMFMDEPTCLMVGDKNVHTTLRYFTDAAALITARVRAQYDHEIYALEREFRSLGVNFGDMRLAHPDFPTWETRYETAFYQLAGGGAGFVHEGRYQLGEFNEFARASTGFDHAYTGAEMLKYHYAAMRGAARRFGKAWGTSIYGQADPKLSPLAITLAYDSGARYIWFWTSDHDHHLPWNEQVELARVLKKHTAEHPRSSIRAPKPTLDKAIVIPAGYFIVLESPTKRRNAWDLWWVRELDPEGTNESSRRYRRLVERALAEAGKALAAGEEFDLVVDDGAEITGYRTVVRLRDE